MAKSAEDILNEMPSGDDLLASIAQEIGIDLNTPVEEEPKVEPKTSVDSGTVKEGRKTDKTVVATEKKKTKSAKRTDDQVNKPTAKGSTEKNKEVHKEKPIPKADKPIKEKPVKKKTTTKKSTEKVDKAVPKSDRQVVFGEWRGFKVNYMGKPMLDDGKFITLPKRYNSQAQEKFRDVNGRMVMVVEKDKEGKVNAVTVYAEDKTGKRDKLTTNGVMVNPSRMENRCRVYAHLLDLAYNRKKDIEEITV